jgi:Haem-binding domain
MLKKIVLALVVLLVAIQFVPQRVFPTTNPPIAPANTVEARTHALTPPVASILKRACYDCHSSQTVWPWYGKVAPISWLLSHDVSEGRREVNFSDWARFNPQRAARKLDKICEEVESGEMPLWYYRPMHAEAKLSAEDRNAICGWTRAEGAAPGPGK